jgi:hypothetical protein
MRYHGGCQTLLFTGGERTHTSSERVKLFEKHAVEPSGATACRMASTIKEVS